MYYSGYGEKGTKVLAKSVPRPLPRRREKFLLDRPLLLRRRGVLFIGCRLLSLPERVFLWGRCFQGGVGGTPYVEDRRFFDRDTTTEGEKKTALSRAEDIVIARNESRDLIL